MPTNVSTSLSLSGTCRSVSSSLVRKNLSVSLTRVSSLSKESCVSVAKTKLMTGKSSAGKEVLSSPLVEDKVKVVGESSVRRDPVEVARRLGDNGKGFRIPHKIVPPPVRNPSPLEKLESVYVKGKDVVQSAGSSSRGGMKGSGRSTESQVRRVIVTDPSVKADVVPSLKDGCTIPVSVSVTRAPLFTLSEIPLPPPISVVCMSAPTVVVSVVTGVVSAKSGVVDGGIKASDGSSVLAPFSVSSGLTKEAEAAKKKFFTELYAKMPPPFGHLVPVQPIFHGDPSKLFPDNPVLDQVRVLPVSSSLSVSSVVVQSSASGVVSSAKGSVSSASGVTGSPKGAPPVLSTVTRKKVRRSSTEIDSSTSPGRDSSDESECSRREGTREKRRFKYSRLPGGKSGGRRGSVV